jgi:hypothetical protein
MEEGGGGGLEPWTRWGKMKAGLVVLLLTLFFFLSVLYNHFEN